MQLSGKQRRARFWHHARAHTRRQRYRVSFLSDYVTPDSGVIDVGAHHGSFAQEFARLHGGRCAVYAFEPFSYNFSILESAVERFPSVHTLRCALSDERGNGHLRIPVKRSGKLGTALAYLNGEGAGLSEHVPVETLDSLLPDAQAISLLKIDVEGGELPVLRGGAALLERNHPSLLLELDAAMTSRRGYDPQEAIVWLAERGYAASLVSWDRWKLRTPTTTPAAAYLGRGDYLFIHEATLQRTGPSCTRPAAARRS